MVWPSMATIKSEVFSPARAAGLPAATLATSAPDGVRRPSVSAISGVTACSRAPSHGRFTALPPLLAEATTTRTMLAGMAKPMPCEPPEREKIAVLMPASRPVMSTNAPPELPGLIAASVWMKN
jgi:hypothetical protein